jgi:hypothetical protein
MSPDQCNGMSDDQLEQWADEHISEVALGILRLLREKREAILDLKRSTHALAAAVAAQGKPITAEVPDMAAPKKAPSPNPILDPLEAQIAATDTVIASAVVLINGISAQIAAAVTAAIANGATADQLAPLTDLTTALTAQTTALSTAVAANTPTPAGP